MSYTHEKTIRNVCEIVSDISIEETQALFSLIIELKERDEADIEGAGVEMEEIEEGSAGFYKIIDNILESNNYKEYASKKNRK